MLTFFRTVLSRCAGLFGASRFDTEMDDELKEHLSLLTERYVNQGMSQEDARHAALRQFGGVTPLKENLRERRTWPQFETTWQDIRYAMRQLRKSPGFTLAAIVTLALGIGANSTVFTIINTAFLRPLPVEKPEQLVFFNQGQNVNFSYPDYLDFRDRNDVLTGLAGCRFVAVGMSISSGNNARAWAYEATANYFDMLGVKPFLGRLFDPQDDEKPGANPAGGVELPRLGAALRRRSEYRLPLDQDQRTRIYGHRSRPEGVHWNGANCKPRFMGADEHGSAA